MPLTFRFMLYVALAWLAAVFDSGVAPLLAIGNFAPSACLFAAALCVSIEEGRYAFLGSALFGLAADVTGTGRLGVVLACFTLAAYAMLRLRIYLGWQRLPGLSLLLAMTTLTMALLVAFLRRLGC